MASQEKFISSHRTRVKKAEEFRKNSPEKISIVDREAFVEFYLLEDIVRLYEHRLEEEKNKKVETRAGEMVRKRNLEKFTAVLNIFKSAIEIAWGEITSGNYKAVWKSIPEYPLSVAAKSIRNLTELRTLAVKMLKELSNEALDATQENVLFDESLDKIDDHEANVRRVKGLPSAEEIDEIIRAVEIAIPDKKTKTKPNPNLR